MGSSSSKFKKYLQHGDEYAAMQVYQSSSDLRKALQPNCSYGDHHNHNTPLHYASRHGMKHLIRTFINDLDGNPNKRNSVRQTSLHCVCNVKYQKSPSALERRAYSVILLLSWRGPLLPSGERERIEVNARDEVGNTALHYAAHSGLGKCVEYLVAHGADLFVENKGGLTACDLAMRENDHRTAQFLESKMVFSGTPESASGESSGARASSFDGDEEVYCGLRAQDLQEAKDQLLVETADMLHIPLFTAEALLRHAEWSRENLLDLWMRDPIQTCQMAGVQPPYSALRHSSLSQSQFEQIASEYHEQNRQVVPSPSVSSNTSNSAKSSRNATKLGHVPMSKSLHLTPKIHSENSFIVDEELAEEGLLCEICCDLMSPKPVDSDMSCGHRFCTRCWKHYLHTKIQEGNTQSIQCPAFECDILVPNQVIECYVSPQMARKFLKFDINAFVETKKDIKWCPFPSCQRAVNLPTDGSETGGGAHGEIQVSHAVDCGGGHFFCWECGSEAHAPTACHLWKMWLNKCARVNPSELSITTQDYQEAANCLWLVTNSKPCPNCQSPIQKNDGCNHMKCSKCKHDFCWVCLESWKKHSTATGGYFRCNRFMASSARSEESGAGASLDKQQMSRMGEKSKRLRELNRFVHYYTRYKNHENSRHMEEPLLHLGRRKRELLESSLERNRKRRGGTEDHQRGTMVSVGEREGHQGGGRPGGDEEGAVEDNNILSRGTKFYEDGVWELVKARLILGGSYAFGFYLAEDNNNGQTQNQSRVAIFEFMQNELEEMTERLSEMIARPYLRTPKRTIIQTYHLCRRKRQEFLRACYRGLVPPELDTEHPTPLRNNPLRVSSSSGHHQHHYNQQHLQSLPQQQQLANLNTGNGSNGMGTISYAAHLRSREISGQPGGTVDVECNRMGDSISDNPYRPPSSVWKRDESMLQTPPKSAPSCSKCRRPSCTAQMCVSGSDMFGLHREAGHGSKFMSLRRENPNKYLGGGTQQALSSSHGSRSGPRSLGARRHTEYVTSSSSSLQREGNLDLMMAVELSHMQMVQEGKGAKSATPRSTGPRPSRSDDNILSSSLAGGLRLDNRITLSSSKEELRQINLAIELSLQQDQKKQPHHRHHHHHHHHHHGSQSRKATQAGPWLEQSGVAPLSSSSEVTSSPKWVPLSDQESRHSHGREGSQPKEGEVVGVPRAMGPPVDTATANETSIDWSSVDWEKLTPEEKWRLEHIKLHEKHRGHESMHAEMVLILFATLVISQIALVKWKQVYPQSYHLVTLLGMWIIPVLMSAKNLWWRFILIWVVMSTISGIIMRRAAVKPIDGTTPRIVYKWFLLMYKASYAIGLIGYVIMMATFLGLYIFFGVKPHVWMDFGILLMFYALYYGVMARDFAEICAEKMASNLGYYKPEGIPSRQLESDMCALCGNKFLVKVGEEGVVENTYRLSCAHEFHEFCIRGWCIVGKKQTCPYCHEKVDLKRMFPNPWEKPHMMYGQLLDWLRWLVCWQPIILVLVQGINWALGLE